MKTILIVDDNEFDRRLIKNALNRRGDFNTIEAHGGDQCLELLKTSHIDLILMDIMMPEILGTQVLMKIREQFNLITLPIIMVTSKTDTLDVTGCLQCGANDYITKPINFDIALCRISTHLMLADTFNEMVKLKEIAALDAMITTYNHEINNPLSIALGCANKSLLKDEQACKKLNASLWRIADIVKKIRSITERKEIEYQKYAGSATMIKLK